MNANRRELGLGREKIEGTERRLKEVKRLAAEIAEVAEEGGFVCCYRQGGWRNLDCGDGFFGGYFFLITRIVLEFAELFGYNACQRRSSRPDFERKAI